MAMNPECYWLDSVWQRGSIGRWSLGLWCQQFKHTAEENREMVQAVGGKSEPKIRKGSEKMRRVMEKEKEEKKECSLFKLENCHVLRDNSNPSLVRRDLQFCILILIRSFLRI